MVSPAHCGVFMQLSDPPFHSTPIPRGTKRLRVLLEEPAEPNRDTERIRQRAEPTTSKHDAITSTCTAPAPTHTVLTTSIHPVPTFTYTMPTSTCTVPNHTEPRETVQITAVKSSTQPVVPPSHEEKGK